MRNKMKLRDYLHKARTPASQFARQLGVAANYLRQINREELIPGEELALQIEIATGGAVKVEELRGKR